MKLKNISTTPFLTSYERAKVEIRPDEVVEVNAKMGNVLLNEARIQTGSNGTNPLRIIYDWYVKDPVRTITENPAISLGVETTVDKNVAPPVPVVKTTRKRKVKRASNSRKNNQPSATGL